MSLSADFIRFALDAQVLRFGEFTTKAGRRSPYFFNAGLFDSGLRLGQLARFYAQSLMAAEAADRLQCDMLFGPAYKGITLASATAVALADAGRDISFAYNRKEAKDHGEGGTLVGAPVRGRVVIIDDVISAGTSVGESIQMIRAAGGEPAGVLIALDRQERSGNAVNVGDTSAVQDIEQRHGLPVVAIATLADLFAFMRSDAALWAAHGAAVAAYRERYGVQ